MQNNVDSNLSCIRLISIFYLPKYRESIITQWIRLYLSHQSNIHTGPDPVIAKSQYQLHNYAYPYLLCHFMKPICPVSMLMCPRGYWVTELQQVIVRNTETSLEFMCFVLIHVIWPKGSQSCFRDRLSLDLISSPCKEDKAKKLFALLIYPLRHTLTRMHTHMLLWVTEEAEQESLPLLSHLSIINPWRYLITD